MWVFVVAVADITVVIVVDVIVVVAGIAVGVDHSGAAVASVYVGVREHTLLL